LARFARAVDRAPEGCEHRPMLIVYKFGPAWGLPDISPFVVKLETWLRLAGIAYDAKPGDVRKAPKKKLPYVVDGETTVADSRFAIEYLEASRGRSLDAHVVPAQRALATAFQSMIEEHLYYVMLYERWQKDENWALYAPTMKEIVGALGVPGPLRGVVANTARKQMLASLQAQGTGRHSPAEVGRVGAGIMEALATQIGGGPFFFGPEPCTLDATAYAFLACILDAPFPGPLRDAASKHANLRAYVDRVRARAWPKH
jgi:glutathione S-transferase